LNTERLEIEWLNHIQSSFPRRVNTPKTELVYTADRYIHLIWRHLLLSPIWVGIYNHNQIQDNLFNVFCLDLDHDHDLEIAHMDALTLYKYFQDEFGREARLYFSGRKGFHIYLDFHPYIIGVEDFQTTFRIFTNELEKELGVSTIDHHCIEPNRVIRLPFTPHEKSKRWCIPINPAWNLTKIVRESVFLDDCWNIDTAPKLGDYRILEKLQACQTKVKEQQSIPQRYPELDARSLGDEIELINQLAPFVLDGRHRMLHYMLVPRLVHAGYNRHQIHQVCQQWIEATGKQYPEYQAYVERSIYRNIKWNAWSFSRFFFYYPELAGVLAKLLEEQQIHESMEIQGNDK